MRSKAQAPDLDRARVEEMVRGNVALQERVNAVSDLKQRYEQLASGISSSITGAFRSIIDGSKSAEEAMADMLEGIGKAFIDMAMEIIQKQLTMIIYGTIMKALGIAMPGASAGSSAAGGAGAAGAAGIGAGSIGVDGLVFDPGYNDSPVADTSGQAVDHWRAWARAIHPKSGRPCRQ